jgi:hypothetical protein
MDVKGWTNRVPMKSPWVPGEEGLLFAERVEPELAPVPDMTAAGSRWDLVGRCCGQEKWRQQGRR